ncbi:hypothetical protein GCM10027162_37940 [Streptomyces incanus]
MADPHPPVPGARGRTAHRGGQRLLGGAEGGACVLFTMAAGVRGGLTTVAAYRSCSLTGPWRGPAKESSPALPPGGTGGYNPQAHPEPSGDGRLVLSYDVNLLETSGAGAAVMLSRNVSPYRPRFLTVRPGP